MEQEPAAVDAQTARGKTPSPTTTSTSTTEQATESATEDEWEGAPTDHEDDNNDDNEDNGGDGDEGNERDPLEGAKPGAAAAESAVVVHSGDEDRESRPTDDWVPLPSEEHEAYFLLIRRADLDPTFEPEEKDPDLSGKWMLFYRPDRIDRQWQRAVHLLATGRLNGIHTIKVATARPNPRASSNAKVLVFYCSPCTDRPKVMAAGRCLLTLFSGYSRLSPYLYYKSDAQTMGGTRATGQLRNWLYRIRLPPEPPKPPEAAVSPAAVRASPASRPAQRRGPVYVDEPDPVA